MPPAAAPDIYIGSASNLVSAALQTAGFYLQGDILNGYRSVFESLAMLFWVVSAVGALYQIAVYGGYKQGLLLLIGPALFWVATTTKVEAGSSKIQVGSRVDVQSVAPHLAFLRLTTSDPRYEQPTQISWFFTTYDRLVTTSVQTIVNFLVDVNRKQDITAAAQEQVYLQVLKPSTEYTQFAQLVSVGYVNGCADLTKQTAQLAQIRESIKTINASPPDPESAKRLLQLQQIEGRIVGELDGLRSKRVTLKPALREYIATFIPAHADRSSLTCNEIWFAIRDAAIHEARNRIERETNRPTTTVPWTEVRDRVERAIGAGDQSRAAEVVAAILLRNTVNSVPHQAMLESLYERSPVGASLQTFLFGDWSFAFGEGYLLSLQYFAGTINYVQGLLLYFLAGLMPFFALLFLIPSRMNGVLIWFGLWAWVKSWDIGFAIINSIRDTLWTLFFTRVPISGTGTGALDVDWSNPASVLQLANSFDPSANMTTYLVLITTLSFAVPVVTAQMFSGASLLANNLGGALDVAAKRFQTQAISSARRGIASGYENSIHASNRTAQQRRAASAMKGRGGKIKNSAGEFHRDETGDGAFARHVVGEAMRGEVENAFSPEQRERQALLAMMNNRPIQQGGGFGGYSGNLLSQKINTMNEQLEARPWKYGSGDTMLSAANPKLNSPLAANMDVRPRKVGQAGVKQNQAGDPTGDQ